MQKFLAGLANRLFLTKIRKTLQGKKTYILLALYALANSQEAVTALQQLSDGQIDLVQFLNHIEQIILAFAGMAAKAGFKRVQLATPEIPKEEPKA